MQKLIKSIPFCILLFVGQSMAADLPRPSERDSRIQYIQYRNNDVVQLSIVVGTGSRIVFGGNEEIVNIASGFTQGWQFEPVKNELFVSAKSLQLDQTQSGLMTRPIPGEWDTNLMVTTTRGLYDFDLRLLEKDGRIDGSRAFFRIEFEYPEDFDSGNPSDDILMESALTAPAPSIPAAPQNTTADAEPTNLRTSRSGANSLDTTKKLPPRNDEYSMVIGSNSKSIAPKMAYDDGLFTYLMFEENLDIPSAYLVRKTRGKEVETLVNGHVDPDRPEFIVLHRVTEKIRLRLDDSVVDIFNENFNPSGVAVKEGTTIPGVKRVVR